MVNLIPTHPGSTPSYWCTFGTQNLGRDNGTPVTAEQFEGDEGALLARDSLNTEILFGANGWAVQLYPTIRSDLYLVLDDGWDVPYRTDPRKERWRFGSLILSEDRFPGFGQTPVERLTTINQRLKALGWRGAGLWVAAQALGEGRDEQSLTISERHAYWRERLVWSRQAQIEYWKVDWGLHAHDLEFRRMLTDMAREMAPGLIIEHAACIEPLNNQHGDRRFGTWSRAYEEARGLLVFSTVLRAYDVTPQLATVSMLDRIAELLQMPVAGHPILNAEDEVYLGAALGCSLGIMRSSFWKEIEDVDWDPRKNKNRSLEVVRAVRWQRIAPAFGVGYGSVSISDNILTDDWLFQRGDTWASWLIAQTVQQHAPAIVSRGLEIKSFQGTPPLPFVVASQHPNGAVAVATLPRSLTRQIATLRADATLFVENVNAPIGIFGNFKSLTITATRPFNGARILAQDLAIDTAVDISEQVLIKQSQVTIPGDLINRIGTSVNVVGDISDPGLVILIEG